MIRIFKIACLFYIFLPLNVWAGTCGTSHCTGSNPWTADSASYANVNYCVSTCASSGDTVNVPAGSATWSSQLALTQSIYLIGAGINTTTITAGTSYPLRIEPTTPSDNPKIEVSGFTFDANNTYGLLFMDNDSLAYPVNQIRVYDNEFADCRGSAPFLYTEGQVYGVFHSNDFNGYPHIDPYNGLSGDAGKIAWNNKTLEFGEQNTLFFEDNTFSIANGQSNHMAFHTGGHGGRYVARYNEYTVYEQTYDLYPLFDAHGCPSTNVFANMVVEAYGNTLTFTQTNGDNAKFMHLWGGQALAFFNQMIGYRTYYIGVDYPYSYAWSPHSNSEPLWPHESYFWNNRKHDASIMNAAIENNYGGELAENVEFFNYDASFDGSSGVGCGSSLPSASGCTDGVGFWVTTQSCASLSSDHYGANPTTPISGTLYVCNSEAWDEYYTPYTYPHPLRSGGSGAVSSSGISGSGVGGTF